MIVLHKEKIIALKARKVGGTSFEIALSRYADEKSIITPIIDEDEMLRSQLCFTAPQNYQYTNDELKKLPFSIKIQMPLSKKKRFKFYNHMPAALIKKRLGDHIWSTYTKVAIIRNPFDYMVSSFFWELKTKKNKFNVSFEEYVLKKRKKLFANDKIYKIDNENIINHMIRYDKSEQDMLHLEQMHQSLEGLTETFKNLSTKGGYRPKSATSKEMYANAPRALECILENCRENIEKYEFDVPILS
jgi:hypothetical protein